ncbi:MFS transporter, MHS family, citrate/tricarballylate:H+ symporter [Rhizobium sp. RU35A]|uniref:MFS transporter n=1 Tax=Rhizobium sp. RU35A TaxID=1907414 RepID=UPI000955BB3B|nr:MFS transporter [Rhizobium sp. RU35A]SIR02061.1 MFS transporter, MHS family, citrate/tricarballylate:H+ symporter [Rhizobium sp. RU35A]
MKETRTETIKTVLRVTSGNFLEMFDFFLFGIYASHIAATFFPNDNPFVSLMATFLSFAAGFVMRPIGALTLGPYIDRIGRRKGLIVTLAIMAMGTVLIAFVPGYATIGIAAPLLVLTGRLLQGFSAGVELGGVSVYLSEMATPGNKGFYVSWQSASQQVAIVVAALLGFIINNTLMPSQISNWGWRIPFFIGCMIIPFIFIIRRSLQETKEFSERKHQPSTAEIFRTLFGNWQVVLGGVGMVMMTTVSFYLITVYTPSFGKTVLHLTESQALLATMAVGISNFIWLPIAGAASDRIGRKAILITFTLLAVLTAYPALAWLASDITFAHMVIVELWLSFIYAWYNGAMVVGLTEVVPVTVRTAGFSLAYSLATTLGGSSLAISTWAIEVTGDKAAPGYWMSFAAVCGLAATLFLYRRNGAGTAASAAAAARR